MRSLENFNFLTQKVERYGEYAQTQSAKNSLHWQAVKKSWLQLYCDSKDWSVTGNKVWGFPQELLGRNLVNTLISALNREYNHAESDFLALELGANREVHRNLPSPWCYAAT